jgi:LmbE family N-acetylglucosaminyl deacetylase
MNLLISPHDDDQALFASFTCLREKPLVVLALDSWIQPNRGERGCSASERAAETEAACDVLGCEVLRLGLRDDSATPEQILDRFRYLAEHADTVYAPAVQGGNRHHDWVGQAAREVFGGNVIEYTTYTKTELWTRGNIEVIPTAEELEMKRRALDCYPSQWRINRPHFEAVLGKSEWLN